MSTNIQAWSVPVAELLERRGAHGDPASHPAQRQLHLPVRRRRPGRHPVVARSRRLPPGNRLRRSHHTAPERRRLLSISKASQGDPHSHRFLPPRRLLLRHLFFIPILIYMRGRRMVGEGPCSGGQELHARSLRRILQWVHNQRQAWRSLQLLRYLRTKLLVM
jgi:hypothetical protein